MFTKITDMLKSGPFLSRLSGLVESLLQMRIAEATLTKFPKVAALLARIAALIATIRIFTEVYGFFSTVYTLLFGDINDDEAGGESSLWTNFWTAHPDYFRDNLDLDNIINLQMFFTLLFEETKVQTLHRVSTFKEEPKIATLNEIIDAPFGQFHLEGEWHGFPYALSIKHKRVLISCPSYEYRDELIQSINTQILMQLKDSIIEIGRSRNEYDDRCINYFDFKQPELYDKDLYASLHAAIYNSINKGVKTGILVYGVPGVSKTMTVMRAMGDVSALKFRVRNSGYDTAKQNLERLKAKKIVLIDDIDTVENEHKTAENSELLNFLDSNVYDVAIIVLNENKIMAPLVRAGRCDIKFFCDRPAPLKRLDILKNLKECYKLTTLDIDGNAEEIKSMTDSMVHADLHNIIKNVVRYDVGIMEAIKKTIEFNSVIDRMELEE